MSKTKKLLIGLLLLTVVLLGIGYATIQNVTLNIAGTATADPSQSNFSVKFTGVPQISDETKATAEITDDTNSTINVEGLTSKGEYVTVTYTVKNESSDLSADLFAEITNSNEEFFSTEAELGKNSILADEETTLTVKIELIKTPISETEEATIGIQLTATPVQPGEEGTTNGSDGNGGNQGGNSNISGLNEYGFYYEVPYSMSDAGIMMSIVFYEDGSGIVYYSRIKITEYPAGTFIYGEKSISADGEILEVYENGTVIGMPEGGLVAEEGVTVAQCGVWGHSEGDGLEHSVDENCPTGHFACQERCGYWEIPENCTYTMASAFEGEKTTYTEGETLPECYISQEGDIFYCGDYEYHFAETYNSTDEIWESALITEWNARVMDDTKTEYGEICSSINGDTVGLYYTFSGCTSLVTAPEIPEGITNLIGTFSGCILLKNVPTLPESTVNMMLTFFLCVSLTEAPEIPDGTMCLLMAFMGCGSMVTAPEIPEGVVGLMGTFSVCSSLTTAPKIPNSVTELGMAFSGCENLKTYVGSTDADGDFSNYVIPTGVKGMANMFDECIALKIPPQIPTTVTDISNTFYGCTSLTTAPEIPENVKEMYQTFYNCSSLTGTIQINTDKINANDEETSVTNNGYQCFYGTTKPIILNGTNENIETLELLAGTANNNNVTIE